MSSRRPMPENFISSSHTVGLDAGSNSASPKELFDFSAAISTMQQYVITGISSVGGIVLIPWSTRRRKRGSYVSHATSRHWWIWCFSNSIPDGKSLDISGVLASRKFASTVSVWAALDFGLLVSVNCQIMVAQDLGVQCHHLGDEEELCDLNVHPHMWGFQVLLVLISSGWEVRHSSAKTLW